MRSAPGPANHHSEVPDASLQAHAEVHPVIPELAQMASQPAGVLDPLHLVLGAAAAGGTALVSVVSWFTVRLIGKVEEKLESHDERIGNLEGTVAVLKDRGERA